MASVDKEVRAVELSAQSVFCRMEKRGKIESVFQPGRRRRRPRRQRKKDSKKTQPPPSLSFFLYPSLSLSLSLSRARALAHSLPLPSSHKKNTQVARLARSAATTFAPRASGATGKNPAFRGSTLYGIFGVQAWLSVAVGGLLSFNLIFPSDEPSIARLIGMWSIWMFTVPALRARECSPAEKDALNLLFLLIPLANVGIPVFARSFPLVFSADVFLLFGVLAWKGAAPWQAQEVEE